jgi:hypothetical protein
MTERVNATLATLDKTAAVHRTPSRLAEFTVRRVYGLELAGCGALSHTISCSCSGVTFMLYLIS